MVRSPTHIWKMLRTSLLVFAGVFLFVLVVVPAPTHAATFSMQTGYYIGNGSSTSISGLGFQPNLVIVKSDGMNGVDGAVWTSSVMPAGTTAKTGDAEADATNGSMIESLDSTGFTVGSSSAVNALNVRYVYVAFAGSDCTSSGTFCVTSYTGNGSSGLAVSTGFQPDLVWVKHSTGTDSGAWRTSAMATNVTQYFTTNVQGATGKGFESLTGTGFTVGTSTVVNTNGDTYWVAAFKEVTGAMNVGSYTGTGSATSTTGMGFQPNFVMVKNSATVNASAFGLTASDGNYMSSFIDTGNIATGISSLDANGFSVGTGAGVNGSGDTIYWAGFGGAPAPSGSGTFEVANGTYTGNGSTQSITGLGFPPDLVVIAPGDVTGGKSFRTRLMKGDSTIGLGTAVSFTGGITSLDSNGFTMGTSTNTNNSGTTYYWTAYGNAWNPETKSGAADFTIGAYTGSGAAGRSIASLPFQPDLVVVKDSSINNSVVWKSTAQGGATSSFLLNFADTSTAITALTTNGFSLGATNASVNSSTDLYEYFAFKQGTNFKVGTYTGNGTSQTISGLGFQPDMMWTKANTIATGSLMMSPLPSPNSFILGQTAMSTVAITGLTSDGFTVGNGNGGNQNGSTYYYAAWQGKSFSQRAYGFFNNQDSAQVSSTLAATNTTATLPSTGAAFRLRLLLGVASDTLDTGGQNFKLRFASSTNCGTATYTDVAISTTIAFNNNPTASDGDLLIASSSDPTDGGTPVVDETYNEQNTFTAASSIQAGQDGEWDFSLIDNGAPSSTTYCFEVTKSDGTALASYAQYPAIVTAVSGGPTVPGAPRSLAAATGNTQISLSWTAPNSNGGSALTQYLVYGRFTGSSTFNQVATTSPSQTTSTVTGLTNGQSYDFEIIAQNAIGTSTPSIAVSSTPATVPSAPTGVTAFPGNAQATVNFTPGSNGGSAILFYTASSSPGGFAATSSGSSITVTGLPNGTAYTFTVTATNAAGTSATSAASNSVTPAAQNTYYVDNAGNNANAGTSPGAGAWQTVAYGLSRIQAGDTLVLTSGQTFAENGLTLNTSGTQANPILITTSGSGKATISSSATTTNGLMLHNVGYVTVNNLYVTGPGYAQSSSGQPPVFCTASYADGIAAVDDAGLNTVAGVTYPGITIINNEVSNFFTGICLYGSTPTSGYTNPVVSYNTVHDMSGDGITMESNSGSKTLVMINPVVSYNRVYNIYGNANTTAGCPIVIGYSSGALVEYNTLYDSGQLSTNSGGGPGGVVMWYSDSPLLQWNEVHGIYQTSANVDGVGLDFDEHVSNGVMQYNYVHGNHGDGLYSYLSGNGNTYRFNVVVNNDGDGLSIYRTGSNNGFNAYNNTFIGHNTSIRTALASPSSTLIANNIFVGGQALSVPNTSDVTVAGNDYWSSFNVNWGGTTYRSLASFQASTTQEAGTGFVVKPGPVNYAVALNDAQEISSMNEYKLTTSGALLGQGLNLNSLYGINPGVEDIAGNILPASGYSVGAYNAPFTPDDATFRNAALADFPMLMDPPASVMTATGTYATGSSLVNSDPEFSSLALDGATSYIDFLGINSAGTVSAMSIEVVVNNARSGDIVGEWNNPSGYAVQLKLTTSSEAVVALNGSGGQIIGSSTVNITGLTDFVITWTGNQLLLYVNGVNIPLSYSVQNTLTSVSFSNLRLGASIDSPPQNYWSGNILPLVFYTKVLSPARILAHYNAISANP